MKKRFKCDECVYESAEQKILILQCMKCENRTRYEELDVGDKCLIQLYEKSLKENNLELVQSTYLELIKTGIDDITTPNNI